MKKPVKPIPEGFHNVSTFLCVRDGEAAIEFYRKVFGATEIRRVQGPQKKKVLYSEHRIGDSVIFVSDEIPGLNKVSQPRGASRVSVHVFVDDADATFKRALAAGATERLPIRDMFWGDRAGAVADPFGHEWYIASRKENLDQTQTDQRAAAFFADLKPKPKSLRP